MNKTLALYRAGLGLIALRVLDDTVLQPPPGTSFLDHPLSAIVPLVALALAAVRFRPWLALVFGVLGIAAGVDGAYYLRGPEDVTGLVAIGAGLGLIGVATAGWWRSRRRRVLKAIGAVALLFFVIAPMGFGYVTGHVARDFVPENHLGVPTENVRFESSDGLMLDGWYVPSRNGAAIIVFAGRKGPQAQARMLARHGYGVLLFDRRGEGRSEGQPNSWGWNGERDVKGAIAFLKRRGIDRIGGIGLSVGGEMLLETAAETRELDAVVSDGAGSRSMKENPGDAFALIGLGMRDLGVAVALGHGPPPDLDGLVARIQQPALLIAAPNSPNGERLNRDYARGSRAQLWEIPEAKHTGGIKARPAEYERRVVGFFDDAL